MPRLLLLSMAVFTACGRGEVTTDSTATGLVGRYELGPDTAQGIVGTPGKYGRLALHADGTFDVTFAPGGCIMLGGQGTWVPFFDGARLEVQSGEWLGAPDTGVRVTALSLSPGLGGVHITAPLLQQDWVQTVAGE